MMEYRGTFCAPSAARASISESMQEKQQIMRPTTGFVDGVPQDETRLGSSVQFRVAREFPSANRSPVISNLRIQIYVLTCCVHLVFDHCSGTGVETIPWLPKMAVPGIEQTINRDPALL